MRAGVGEGDKEEKLMGDRSNGDGEGRVTVGDGWWVVLRQMGSVGGWLPSG